jgi:FdhE protein
VPDERIRPLRPPRSEPREIAELRRIKDAQPDLASAVDLQVALLQLQHRVRARLSTPWVDVDPARLKRQQEEGRPLLRFEDIQISWTDFRLIFRQTADLLLHHEALEPQDHARVQAITRDGHALEPLVINWFNLTADRDRRSPTAGGGQAPSPAAPGSAPQPEGNPDGLEQVLALALRPFLERCAELLLQQADLTGWSEPYCPLCGGEPEFAVITAAADRLLICSRCAGRWKYHPLACPFCRNDNRALVTSFATRDGRYRIYACDVCRRYLKAYDARHATRPVMVAADSVATLPLDAAAMQKGYRG